MNLLRKRQIGPYFRKFSTNKPIYSLSNLRKPVLDLPFSRYDSLSPTDSQYSSATRLSGFSVFPPCRTSRRAGLHRANLRHAGLRDDGHCREIPSRAGFCRVGSGDDNACDGAVSNRNLRPDKNRNKDTDNPGRHMGKNNNPHTGNMRILPSRAERRPQEAFS